MYIIKLIVHSANWVNTIIFICLPRINVLWPTEELIILCLHCTVVLKQLLAIYRLFIHFEIVTEEGRKYFHLYRQWVVGGLQTRRNSWLYVFQPRSSPKFSAFSLCHAGSVLPNTPVPIKGWSVSTTISRDTLYCNNCI